jgi:Glycosyltransferase like family
VITFGCSILHPETYERYAQRGVELAREADSLVLEHAAAGSVARSYNLMLEQAAAHDDLEALVLVHEDAEIVDPGFCSKLRRALGADDVAIAGCVGSVGARGIAWWEGSVTWDAFVRCYREVGDGEVPELSWNGESLPPSVSLGEVDTLDGFVLALSPWAVRELRFDESLDPRHGYDFDICKQARAAGRTVVAADLGVIHHHSLVLVTDPEAWMEAHERVAEKWDGVERSEWKGRARLAEAESGVAKLAGASKLLQAYARAAEHDAEMERVTRTWSWRLTEPLRRANAFRRAHRL